MKVLRPRLLAGGILSVLAGVLVARRRSRRSGSPQIGSDLLDKAREWVIDAELPEHVRDVAKRILVVAQPPEKGTEERHLSRRIRTLRRH